MEKQKSLVDISWQVSEEEYRQDHAFSYSTLAKFEREGFNNLAHLFDKVDSPSLLFGSCVDAIMTGGMDEFNERFFVGDFPELEDKELKIVKMLFNEYSSNYSSIFEIPYDNVRDFIVMLEYHPNWREDTRVKVLKDHCAPYYDLLHEANGKTLVDSSMSEAAQDCVSALYTSPATAWYFQSDYIIDESGDEVERYYQLKFRATFNGIDYRCMADELVVNYTKKIIYPIDLKTSSHTEWDFYKSFMDWRYDIQARLYWRIIRACLDADPYFKDFTLLDYRFIVVNRVTLTPLVWLFENTADKGELTLQGKEKTYILRDPETIASELKEYLDNTPKVPVGISLTDDNKILQWL